MSDGLRIWCDLLGLLAWCCVSLVGGAAHAVEIAGNYISSKCSAGADSLEWWVSR